MVNAVAVQDNAPSIIADMAKRYGMDKRAFEATVKATCMPANTQVSNEQFVAFLLVAKEYNLNPITKEIFAFPSRGGIVPIVGVDGWCNIINSNPQLDGIEFADIMTEGKLSAITCRIFRKDRAKPTECTEYLEECRIDSKEPWKKWPARMLRHKALIQCARYAFSLSGIVDQDEAERMEMVDVTPQIRPADLDKSKPASPFKTATLRNTFHKNTKESLNNAKTLFEANSVMDSCKAKFVEMEASGDERDQLSVDDLRQYHGVVVQRFMEPEENTFDAEEVEKIPFIQQQINEEQEARAAKGAF